MHQCARSNIMIMGLIVVLLFFSLTATITLQVFYRAHMRSNESTRTTYALEYVQDWAERIGISDSPEELLLTSGWERDGGVYTYEYAEDGITLVAEPERVAISLGQFLTLTIEAYDEKHIDRPMLVSLPIERYLRETGGGS